MKTFLEFGGTPPKQIEEAVYFKVTIPDMSPTFIQSTGGESAVKVDLRKKLKPDVFKEIAIERVTRAAMKKMYRDMAQETD
jgi:hypothetical protein